MRVERIDLRNVSRDEWLALRKDDLTASVAGAVLGDHKYATLRSLAVKKADPTPPKDNSNDGIFRRGHIMEPAIARALERDHGLVVENVKHYLRGRSAEDPYLRIGATKDFQLSCPAEDLKEALGRRFPREWEEYLEGLPMSVAVEAKSVAYDVFHREYHHGPPADHVAQVGTQAMLAGDDGGLIVVIVLDRELSLHLYPVPRSGARELAICEGVSAFWQRFESGESQPVQDGDLAKDRHPTADPEKTALLGAADIADTKLATLTTKLIADTDVLVGTMAVKSLSPWTRTLGIRAAAAALRKTAEGYVKRVDEVLKRAIGDAETASIPGWKVTWKNNVKGVRKIDIRRKKQ